MHQRKKTDANRLLLQSLQKHPPTTALQPPGKNSRPIKSPLTPKTAPDPIRPGFVTFL